MEYSAKQIPYGKTRKQIKMVAQKLHRRSLFMERHPEIHASSPRLKIDS
jgi:hypothetical protein